MGAVSESQSKLLLWLRNLNYIMFFFIPVYVYIFTFILWDTNKGLKNKLKLVFHCTRHSVNPLCHFHSCNFKTCTGRTWIFIHKHGKV